MFRWKFTYNVSTISSCMLVLITFRSNKPCFLNVGLGFHLNLQFSLFQITVKNRTGHPTTVFSLMYWKHFKLMACFKRRATAVPNSINRIWHGSGARLEIIQFSNLNLVRHGNQIRQVCRAKRQWHGSVSNAELLPCRTQFINYENVLMRVLSLLLYFILSLARLN